MPEVTDSIVDVDFVDPTLTGGRLFHVENTDAWQAAIEWNRPAKKVESVIRRITNAWNELPAALEELRELQTAFRERRISEHPDAGEALNHIDTLKLDFDLPAEANPATIAALAAMVLPVRLQDLSPVSAANQPNATDLYTQWNPALDHLAACNAAIDEATATKKLERQKIRAAGRVIADCNTVIAEQEYEIASVLVDLRALQRIAVALDVPGAPTEIHNAASVNLRVNPYEDTEVSALCEQIPSLRLGAVGAAPTASMQTGPPVETGGGRYGPAP